MPNPEQFIDQILTKRVPRRRLGGGILALAAALNATPTLAQEKPPAILPPGPAPAQIPGRSEPAPVLVDERKSRTPEQEQEALKALGVEDFHDLLIACRTAELMFGARRHLRERRALELAASGAVLSNNPLLEVQRLSDGWGEKRAEAQSEASERLKNIQIDTTKTGDSPETRDDPEKVREFLEPFALYFPAMVLASPLRIEVIPAGGFYRHNQRLDLSTIKNLENAKITASHELTHAGEINWEVIKDYLNRKDFADYITLKLQRSTEIFKEWVSLPWEQASIYKSHTPLLLPTIGDGENRKKWIEEFERAEEPLKPLMGAYPNPVFHDDDINLIYRYNQVAHFIGKNMAEAHENLKNARKLTPVQDFIRNFAWTSHFTTQALENIDHHFVGPVTNNRVQMVSELPNEVLESNSLLRANGEIQRARIKTYSTLPEDTTYAQLRQALGLPEKTPTIIEAPQMIERHALLTQSGFKLSKEIPLYKGDLEPGMLIYEAPENLLSPNTRAILVNYVEPSLQAILIQIPKDRYGEDFSKWKVEFKNKPNSLLLTPPDSDPVTVSFERDYALEIQTSDPAYSASAIDRIAPATLEPEVLQAPLVVKRDSLGNDTLGVAEAGKVVFMKNPFYLGAYGDIDIFPIPEGLNHAPQALRFRSNVHDIMVIKGAKSDKFGFVQSGKLQPFFQSGLLYITSDKEQRISRLDHNSFHFNNYDDYKFSVLEQDLPDFIKEIQSGNKESDFTVIITQQPATNPGELDQVQYQLIVREGATANGPFKRFPLQVTIDK